MTPVVLHLGFHKTGTSSAQGFLNASRAALAPWLTLGLLGAVRPAEKAARRFSKRRDAGSLIETGMAFDQCLSELWPDPDTALLISCEGLAGDIPGRRGIADYMALADLAPVYLECLRARRPDLNGVRLILSLRQGGAWLRSAWLQNLWGTRLTLDFDAYAVEFQRSADLPAVVAAVQDACPDVPVEVTWLEESGPTRFGPATPLLAAFDLPPALVARLPAARRVNASIEADLIPRCLALNRGPLDGADLKAAKQDLLRARDPG